MSDAPFGSPKDPLDLERLHAEERLAATPVGSHTLSEDRGKGKKKRPSKAEAAAACARIEASALSGVPLHDLLDTHAEVSDFSDIESGFDTDSESESEDDTDTRRKRVALDPKRIVLADIDQQ